MQKAKEKEDKYQKVHYPASHGSQTQLIVPFWRLLEVVPMELSPLGIFLLDAGGRIETNFKTFASWLSPSHSHLSKSAASSLSLLQFWLVVTGPTRPLQEEARNLANSYGKCGDMVASYCQSSAYGCSIIYWVVNYPKTYRLKAANNYYLSFWGRASEALNWVPLGQLLTTILHLLVGLHSSHVCMYVCM